MAKRTHTLIGGGECFVGPLNDSGALRFLGEASQVELSFDEDKKTLKNYSTPGGGNADTTSLITDVQLSITAHGFDTEALAMATFGEAGFITGAAVTDEEHVLYKGGLIRADEGVGLTAVTLKQKNGNDASVWVGSTAYGGTSEPLHVIPSVTNTYFYRATTAGTSDASEPTWPTTVGETVVDGTVTWTCVGKIDLVAGTDYEVKGGGVQILKTAVNVEEGETVLFSYTHANAATVEAILNTGKEYRFVFDGFNQANDNTPVVMDVWRAKNTPSSLGLVTDDFGNIEFVFDVLRDDSKTGEGISQFFKLTQVEE